jgi:NAD(P) transhydrogenase
VKANRYDLVVLGGGPVGVEGARAAARFGQRVALVERSPRIGGADANTGTLPSKTLRETALALSGLRSRNLYGVDLSLRREVTVADLMYHEERVSAGERALMHLRLATAGDVELYVGTGRFHDPHTVYVQRPGADDLLLYGERILVATGSSPQRPAIFPFEDPRVYDSDEILELERLPQRLAVVGAGVIGIEYASTFAALGAEVHVVDGRDQLLSFLDAEVSRALAAVLQEQLGIRFHWRERVTACDAPGDPDAALPLRLGSGATLPVDAVLVAAGRCSNVAELDLDAAGLAADAHGLLTVDRHFQTPVAHIYAAGDVIGFPGLAATGMEQARVAMCHAFEQHLKEDLPPLLPHGVYTIPEVGMVGATEEELRAQGVDYVVGRAAYAANARGRIIGDASGFLKLLFRRADGRLLGVHVMGEHATEVVHVGVVAMMAGGDLQLFNRTCFNYPTLGDLYKDAAYDALAALTRGESTRSRPD